MKSLSFLLMTLFFNHFVLGQAPERFQYQGIIRDSQGQVLANQNVALRFNLHRSSATGLIDYSETHNVTTNSFGLVTLEIGGGAVLSGSMSAIDWAGEAYFLEVELDPAGGSAFSHMGTSELLSVPYALSSNRASEMTLNDLTDVQGTPANGEILKWTGSNWTPAVDDTGQSLSPWSMAGPDIHFNTGRVGVGIPNPAVRFHVADGASVLFGADTVGAGSRLLWWPARHAFRVGYLASGTASTYWHPDSLGEYSFASGINTRATGFGSTAMGRDSEANGSYSFATGFFTNADGQYSTALGFNTDALGLGSTALGYSTDAEENYSFAAGYFAEAQAIYSVAIGFGARAQSYSSLAVGRYNTGGGSATAWVGGDPVFEVGIGSSNSNRANALTILKNGNMGLGTTNPQDVLHVNGRIRLATVEYFEDGGTNEIACRGDIRPTGNNTYDLGTSTYRWDDVYATNGTINTSDRRDKQNIRALDYGLETVMKLRPVRFQWKAHPEQGDKLGLIAQDLLPLVPEVVKTHDFEPTEESEDLIKQEVEHLGVYYSDLIPVLVKAVQEQQKLIDAQQHEIESLRARLARLE